MCSITLHDDNALAISVESLLEDGHYISYTLPEDRKYSTYFEISNAAGTWIISGSNFSEIHMYILLGDILEYLYFIITCCMLCCLGLYSVLYSFQILC